MKKPYPSIPGLEPDAWSNDACRGYVIMAMQDCGFSHEDIRRVVRQLYEVFDFHTINEAEQKYYHGDYCPRAMLARSWGKLKERHLPGCRFLTFPHSDKRETGRH